ncbi:MAG: hypothetical protein Q8L78_01000 [Coxiellaceae bacterium]|nr:hypothetical protein [Coxiellaceae bacterium]
MASPSIDNTKPENAISAKGTNPYYIVAPPYVRTSAGVRVLHLLCHSLNLGGKEAYLIIYPVIPWQTSVSKKLLTPVLTKEIIEKHQKQNISPIVIYPENISGRPLGGTCIVRYVLNFPGLLGGDKIYGIDELCFSYSKKLANETCFPENILFLPATDTSIFYLPINDQRREGSCYFASKYQGELFDITKESTEIKRHSKNAQTTEEVADLLRRSEVFYTYENTALALEAVLCGCPAVFLPTEHTTEIIAIEELGMDGYAFGTDQNGIICARETVNQGIENYKKSYQTYWKDLEKFVFLTQEHAQSFSKPWYVRIPNFIDTIYFTVKTRGFLGFSKLIFQKIKNILR